LAKPLRLDTELVRRRLFSSRTEAREAIEQGLVTVNGVPVERASSLVAPRAPIALRGSVRRFVSRGGDKLDGALERLRVAVSGRRWLDAGASTGGFTDRLLKGGARAVAAVDVGYGQLDWSLRNDARVVVLERTNVRRLGRAELPWSPDGVAADLSFISLTLVLPALVEVASPDADFVLLVKPQFEVGRAAVGPGGVVRDPEMWRRAVTKVAEAGAVLGLGLAGATASSPAGPAGNREFFLHLRRGAASPPGLLAGALEKTHP
jgi:23S rRNA (cytidine1920-2'-O)/16S rRNA (cytidine1409-2'-O)-methyltransferase